VDQVLPAGRNSFTWDPYGSGGMQMRAGVFYLGLRAEGVSQTRRFVLLGPGPGLHDQPGQGN
jgi:hypothetical protein